MKKRPASSSKTSGKETELAVEETVAWLEGTASRAVREGMARFGIPSDKALGVTVGDLRAFAKQMGQDHALSEALWVTDIYEARLLAIFLDDPALVDAAQMDRWCGDFEDWSVCDTACFHLFDKTPHAFPRVEPWVKQKGEFQKRAGFALLASLALHHKKAPDAAFLPGLPLIETAADDDRNFVKKAVNWALRAIGSRNPPLHAAALATATRLAASTTPSARWIGKDALRQLNSPATLKRIIRKWP